MTLVYFLMAKRGNAFSRLKHFVLFRRLSMKHHNKFMPFRKTYICDGLKGRRVPLAMHYADSSSTSKLSRLVNFPKSFCTGECSPKPPDCSDNGDYHEELENAVNQQILAELSAFYVYLSMACYFGRTDVALPGCHGFFSTMVEEEYEHALAFVNYQLMRGGEVALCPLKVPKCQDWKSVSNALSAAIKLEKTVKKQLITVHDAAEKHHDLTLMDMVANTFILEQERSICELSRLLARVKLMGDSGVATFLFDKEMHQVFLKKAKKSKEESTNKFDVYI